MSKPKSQAAYSRGRQDEKKYSLTLRIRSDLNGGFKAPSVKYSEVTRVGTQEAAAVCCTEPTEAKASETALDEFIWISHQILRDDERKQHPSPRFNERRRRLHELDGMIQWQHQQKDTLESTKTSLPSHWTHEYDVCWEGSTSLRRHYSPQISLSSTALTLNDTSFIQHQALFTSLLTLLSTLDPYYKTTTHSSTHYTHSESQHMTIHAEITPCRDFSTRYAYRGYHRKLKVCTEGTWGEGKQVLSQMLQWVAAGFRGERVEVGSEVRVLEEEGRTRIFLCPLREG